jgi:signal transduction histidine kinase
MGPTAFVRHGPRRAIALAAAAGALMTLVSLVPLDSVAYHSPTLHVAIETVATFVGLVVAVLVFGRFLRAPAWAELVLAASLLVLALTNLCFAVIPWLTRETMVGSFDTWAPVAGRLVGAFGLAVAAWLPSAYVSDARRSAIRAVGVVLGILLAIGLLGALLAPHLPAGIDPDLPPSPGGPDLVGNGGLLVCQAIGLVVSAAAAVGFAVRAERMRDDFATCLAAACTLAAFARLNYFLFPSINSEWVYTGDFLRLGFYAVILVGALREIVAYQGELAELRVDRERRRIARDIHDGLAQELAFIVGQAHRLGASGHDPDAHISEAAERALTEARHAIATLSRPPAGTLDASIAMAAEDVALRNGVQLHLDLAPGLHGPDRVHDALGRIAREAVGNAIRHGRAANVTVALTEADGLRLVVEDDGVGLREEGTSAAGFGLISMRERAEALGGTLRLRRRPARGVRLEVWLP